MGPVLPGVLLIQFRSLEVIGNNMGSCGDPNLKAEGRELAEPQDSSTADL